LNLVNYFGRTALDEAWDGCNEHVVRLLRGHRAKSAASRLDVWSLEMLLRFHLHTRCQILLWRLSLSIRNVLRIKEDVHVFGGEFGAELDLFIPYVYMLHEQGRLKSVAVMEGMEAFYRFIPNQFVRVVPRQTRCFPSKIDMSIPGLSPTLFTLFFTSSAIRPFHFPSFPGLYQNINLKLPKHEASKACVIIHNKYAPDQGQGTPINFLSNATIARLRSILKTFTVIIIHPSSNFKGYTPDAEGFATHPFDYVGFLDIKTVMDNNPALDYNTVQLALHDRCKRFISIQGGSSRLASLFGGVNVVLHKSGAEMSADFYAETCSRMSNVDVHIAHNDEELLVAVQTYICGHHTIY